MSQIHFDPIRRVILIGGGAMLRLLLPAVKEQIPELVVATTKRRLDEVVGSDGVTLQDCLKSSGVQSVSTSEPDSPEMRALVGDMKETLAFSVGGPWIFSKTQIEELFKRRIINIHPSRLPLNRGGGVFSWHILRGDRLGGCALHLVSPSVDRGEIIAQEEFVYPPTCRTPADYESYLTNKVARPLVNQLFHKLSKGTPFETLSQTKVVSTYNPRLHTIRHGWIDWTWEASELERFICAFDEPYAGASTMLGSLRVFLKRVQFHSGESRHPYEAGLVTKKKGSRWLVVTAVRGSLVVESVCDERGVSLIEHIRVGDRFITPLEHLIDARQRIGFDAQGAVPMKSTIDRITSS